MKVFFSVFFVFAIFVAFYFITEKNTHVKSSIMETSRETSHSLPEGVMVIEKQGKKILSDQRVGYEMEIPNDIQVTSEGNTVLFYSSETDLPVLGGITIYENPRALTLEQWLENFHKEFFFTFYHERKKVQFGEIETIRIPIEGEMEYYDYYLKKDNKIIQITLVGEEYSGKFLESIKF